MNQVLPNFMLHSKFRFFIYLAISVFLLNILVVYLEINNLDEHLFNLELAEDLNNTVLEIRRYEKNFLLYHDRDSIVANRSYLKKAHPLFLSLLNQTQGGKPAQGLNELGRILESYRALDQDFLSISPDALHEDIKLKIRSTGKKLVDAAESLLQFKRKQVTKAAKRAMHWSLFFMGAMLSLFLIVSRIIIKTVVQPCALIEKATEKVARGNFSPIPNLGKNEEQISHVVNAFNRMAQELEAREEQVIHSRKISSLGTLVSGCAHELNNPINNIVLTADVLSSKKKIDPLRRSQLIDDILKQALRASEVVKNLLEFSRARATQYQAAHLSEILNETLKIAENQILVSHVHLHDEIAEDLPPISCNRQGLQQVFLNLITNALHAMKNGGDLTVRGTFGADKKTRIEIQDTGVGIADEDLPHIFDPFFTTKDVGKGTGLGLSVSFGIIKKHGGQISVKSKVGQGTIFTVTFPVEGTE